MALVIGIALAVMLILGAIKLLIWPFLPAMNELLAAYGTWLPVGPNLRAIAVFASIFVAARFLLLVYQLDHARIDKAKFVVSIAMNDKSERDPGVTTILTGFGCDLVCMVLLMEALNAGPIPWLRESAPDGYSSEPFWPLVGIIITNLVLGLIAVGIARLMFRLAPDHGESSILGSRKELGLVRLALLVIMDAPFILIAGLWFKGDFVVTLLFSLAVSKAVMTGLIEFISCCLDWSSDHWIIRLAKQSVGADVSRRETAINGLREVGRWNGAAKHWLRNASAEGNPGQRDEARKALSAIG